LTTDYRYEVFDEIQAYLKVNETINDIRIADDFNQLIVSKEMKEFYNNIGV